MINEELKNVIVLTLGKKYSRTILKHLETVNIKNEDGNSYSNESIRQFVCGLRENKEVERAIIELVSKEHDEVQELKKLANSTIEKIKNN